MKKRTLFLLLPLFVFSFCSDNGSELTPDPDPETENGNENANSYKTGVDLSSTTFLEWENTGIDDTYFMLGYGYDVTGKYAHPSSVRNKVIDMELFNAYNLDEVTLFKGTSSGPDLYLHGDRIECTNFMGEKTGFTEVEVNQYKNLFRGTFDNVFENDTSFTNLSYYYHGISQVNVLYHSYFLYLKGSVRMKERFQSLYLADEFKNDIETISGEEVIKKYGTHILSGILIGERIDYLYRYAEDLDLESYKWSLYNMSNYFSLRPTILGSKPEKNPPLKENMYIEVVDGTRPDPNAWMLDITNFQGEKIVFNGWDNITDANLTLVDFRGNNCLIPIYEMVKNPDKQEELIKAYKKYLGE